MQDKKTGTIADIINPRNPKVLDPPPIATMFGFHYSCSHDFLIYFLIFKIRIGMFF